MRQIPAGSKQPQEQDAHHVKRLHSPPPRVATTPAPSPPHLLPLLLFPSQNFLHPVLLCDPQQIS